MNTPIIVWLRHDLRLADNPALYNACETGQPVVCVYIDETNLDKPLGAASRWWLHHSLMDFQKNLEEIGGTLCLKRGDASTILSELIKETSADTINWNRRYSGEGIAIDKTIKSELSEKGLRVESFKANLLVEPWEVQTKTGGYYKVFSPFWRAVKANIQVPPALPAPETINGFRTNSLSLDDLNLLPTRPDWGSKMGPFWEIGEAGAHKALSEFLHGPAEHYKNDRDRPDRKGTSRLSPHLAFGEISPRQIWHASHAGDYNPEKFLSEIGWREFAYTLLFYNPDLDTKNFKADFDKFNWDMDEQALERWQMGQTGYPFVDAGMRELWATGWQHNRVRMVTASFLIKHLLLDWREGEAWFWDTLLDADPANNAASWQWVAGSGADAAPYFRIFNPFGQGEKFDPNGDYVRKWVPELAKLPNKFIHQPWTAPKLVLLEAGVRLGETYPHPIVDHKKARERALSAYQETRS